MSSSAYTYVANPSANLTCCICRHPFVDPTTTSCAHTFCYECISNALSHSPQCPVDRLPLSIKDLRPADSIICSLVDELIVECVHREEGCLHTCERQLLATHLLDECAYSEVPCKDANCTQRIIRKELDAHITVQHGDSVKSETSSCDDVDQSTTPNQPTRDIADSPATSDRPNSIEHANLKEFMSTSAARHASLAEQNLILRHRVSTLEASVQIMRREMEAVRRALGPWFRSESNQASYSTDRGTDNQQAPFILVEPSNSSGFETRNIGYGSSSSSSVVLADVPSSLDPTPLRAPSSDHALGSHFPLVENDSADTAHVRFPDIHYRGYHRATPSGSLGFMGQMHPEAYGPLNYAPGFIPLRAGGPSHLLTQPSTSRPMHIANPQLTSVVSPIDSSTTLEGSLNGLRDSVLSLAAGVDSLGRRSEIALTNESLRFGEEVMSLRASINGLRLQAIICCIIYILYNLYFLQLHTMMTERSTHGPGRPPPGMGVGEDNMGGMMNLPRVYHPPAGLQGQGPISITKL
ncbi:hypothetical protein AMATHDRAFT_38647 [Amanita thiersii Skay4041]|uniref:RING-type domain-containing protein n=1 Tax=Amanita thiersii Skay4041 TaxID=703135 RepID=A0A2A9P063_9AGAR|nr:hypothetical protein AMATHDRAFT_38647 [Amanita thiersii Skay4041]